jgi:hypothetical protein
MYYIAFMLMASTFLHLIFNNLPPIIGSHHLWTIIWVLSLILFKPKIFSNKAVIYLLAYGFSLFLATKTIWSNMDFGNSRALFLEFYEIAIGILVITYFFQTKDYVNLAKITRWSIVFLCITAVMSIISSIIDPMYARNIIGISGIKNESEREAILSLTRYGGGNYSTAGAFMCLFPIFIYYYKNIKISTISKKQIIIISVIILLALVGMQIFGNILIAIVFGFVALLGMKKIRQSILIIGLFLSVIVIIPREVYSNTLRSVSNLFDKNSDLNYKFNDLAIFIETGADIYENNTSVAGRAIRYPMLMETFVKSPLLGCYFFSDGSGNGYKREGGHLYWMNKLTVTGILGLLFFLFIPYSFIRNNLKHFNPTYRYYYILATLSIISYGLIKGLGGRETWYAFFIILPGLYYLPLIKKKNKLHLPPKNYIKQQTPKDNTLTLH